MPQPTNTCEDCKWFDENKEDDSIGFCHRHPPTNVVEDGDIKTVWPAVDFDDWCGDYLYNGAAV